MQKDAFRNEDVSINVEATFLESTIKMDRMDDGTENFLAKARTLVTQAESLSNHIGNLSDKIKSSVDLINDGVKSIMNDFEAKILAAAISEKELIKDDFMNSRNMEFDRLIKSIKDLG